MTAGDGGSPEKKQKLDQKLGQSADDVVDVGDYHCLRYVPASREQVSSVSTPKRNTLTGTASTGRRISE